MTKLGKVQIICTVLLLIQFVFFSCASNSKMALSEQEPYIPDSGEAVSIPIPKNKSHGYFSSINNKIIELVEIGSPESIKQAISLLHKSDIEEYEENERVLISVCTSIMKIVWPSQTVNLEIPSIEFSTPYTGAIDSAIRGIYDSSTGNTDFLTILLPSLVLITSDSRSDYYSVSESAITTALSMRENSVLANYLMGVLQRRLNNYELALEYFLRASKLNPNTFEINYSLADSYRKSGDDKKALSIGEDLLVQNQQNVKLLELCAKSSFDLNLLDNAEKYVVRVLLIEPESVEYVLLRARILIKKGDYIKTSSLLDIYARTDQDSCDYLLLRAEVQRDWNKNLPAATATIEKAINLYPNNIQVLLFAAKLASITNSTILTRDSISFAEQVLAAQPNNKEALTIKMSEMKKNGKLKEAYEISSTFANSVNCSSDILYAHIEICIALKKLDEAERLAFRLYTSSPQDENIQLLYLKVLSAYGRITEGLQLIERLLPSASSKTKSSLLYEQSFFVTGESNILDCLRSSLTANPRNRDALYRLYEIYYSKKDWRKAQYYLKQVVALNPSDSKMLRLNSELENLLNK